MPTPGGAGTALHPAAASAARAGWEGGALRSPASTDGTPGAAASRAPVARSSSMAMSSGRPALWQCRHASAISAPPAVRARAITARRGSDR